MKKMTYRLSTLLMATALLVATSVAGTTKATDNSANNPTLIDLRSPLVTAPDIADQDCVPPNCLTCTDALFTPAAALNKVSGIQTIVGKLNSPAPNQTQIDVGKAISNANANPQATANAMFNTGPAAPNNSHGNSTPEVNRVVFTIKV